MKLVIVLFSVLTLASSSFAAEGFTTQQLVQASQAALESYAAENSAHGAHVTGFKTWKSGAEAKVKIYIDHEGMAMESNYLCQQASNQVTCSSL